MKATTYKVRLDPWAAEYEGAIQIAEDDEPEAAVDLEVESRAWAPVRPAAAAAPGRVAFVDGVRRIEHRLLVEHGERTLYGLLGSFAAGATEVAASARIVHERIGRIACVGGGLLMEPWGATLADGRQAVAFTPATVPENTPVAPLQGLQNAMRRCEAELAQRLAPEVDLVYLDGPLTFVTATEGPVVGFVKRLLKSYLPAAESAILRRLVVGERTPLFAIQDARRPRYSWYARIGTGRVIDSALTGVVRLETSGARDLAQARALADASAVQLPRFASDAAHDPRAPQNLYPIGALEGQLRHLLGDHLVIRRAIEAQLHQEAFA